MDLNRRKFARRTAAAVLAGLGVTSAGCSTGPSGWHTTSVSKIFSPRPVAANPLVVPSTDFEDIWNKTVAVVDKYFEIQSENRLSRTIETQPLLGGTVLEPWALDSVSAEERFEASLQTIQKRAVIHIDPVTTGGFLVKVEVRKFLEDMAKPDRQAAGRTYSPTTSPSIGPGRSLVPSPPSWVDQSGTGLGLGAGYPGRHP